MNRGSMSDNLASLGQRAADRNRMTAAVVSAIDQQPTDALGAHVGKGDFGRAIHALMIAPISADVKPLGVGALRTRRTKRQSLLGWWRGRCRCGCGLLHVANIGKTMNKINSDER